ncbi:hypothetical protein ASG40_06885 [Methylobacterium sp. Leaf399]|uniref:class I SAM-dependent methyltransferase n=1 Tax=Methylobacterium sp. Leaf399 TaxID=1736364 RepID=UPI0006F226DF|nr:class I SAM-dependent methyltransferase [Methylobacterium sp. Leaf399]KQT11745.1 hypothetical protein ASG40_06885 [Methylobacterium sp. Leaf399]
MGTKEFRLSGPIAEDLGGGGERFVPRGSVDDTALEHLHRYLACSDLVRGKRVLDVACGEGYGTALLAQSGASEMFGVDVSPQVVDHAVRTHGQWATFSVGDALNLPFGDGSVDVVVSFETIEHLSDQRLFVSEVDRVLARDGIFICSTPNRDVYSYARGGVPNPFHIEEMNLDQFRAMLAKHFPTIAFFGQEIIYGSAIWSLEDGASSEAVSFLSNPSLSRVRKQAGRPPTYHIAVAAKSGEAAGIPPSTLSVDVLTNPVSALLGGIAERDSEILRLRTELARRPPAPMGDGVSP